MDQLSSKSSVTDSDANFRYRQWCKLPLQTVMQTSVTDSDANFRYRQWYKLPLQTAMQTSEQAKLPVAQPLRNI
jgi:hypothetical protein